MRYMQRALAIAGVTLIVAACGGGSSMPTTPASPTPSPTNSDEPVTISVIGERGRQSFSPNPATAAGRLVIFRNNDIIVHHVVLNDLTHDTGDIAPGASSQAVRMPADGTNYHCTLHPTMIGSVGGGTTAPPPCTGIYC